MVYVGDGLWDLRAATAMGITFIGLAEGVRATQLRSEGAPVVFPDFSDVESFMSALPGV